jgi:2-C-methyl-D-erythritol 4-phosphate cytidylyltransferase/2-C-methyl-D-erythritol 2,4-cyclodiphosphate synthase
MAGVIALVVAAGRGSRAGGGIAKQWRSLGGEPLIRHSVRVLLDHPAIGQVKVVIHPDDRALYDEALSGLLLPEPAHGGSTRQESVRLGLESLAGSAPDRVLIHDGARPFLRTATVDAVLAALDATPGAIPALAMTDTVKRGGPLVETTLPRANLWRVQTPQGFRYPDILAAHRTASGLDLPDDAAVAEHAGLPVALVPGDEGNVKITTADDLDRAATRFNLEPRTGMGFDAHRFAAGDFVTLCGVRIPHSHGLEGHSDADAGLHALTDAILGALAMGDIGQHFPPSDPQWKGADSSRFLAHARDLVTSAGGRVLHVDVTLICESPKIAPHRPAMVARMAEILGISADRVSVKATTTEGMGFTGRREGIAAQAVATVEMPGRP